MVTNRPANHSDKREQNFQPDGEMLWAGNILARILTLS